MTNGTRAPGSSPGAAPAWYHPRRGALPAFLGLTILWALPTHVVAALSCHSLACRPDPAAPLLGSLFALPVTYLLAAGLTRVLAGRVPLRSRAAWLFAPPDAVRTGVLVLAALAAALLLAAAYHALYTPVGAAALYVAYFPALVLATGAAEAWLALGLAGLPAAVLSAAVVLLVGAAAQVSWWYLLAHGAARAAARVRPLGLLGD